MVEGSLQQDDPIAAAEQLIALGRPREAAASLKHWLAAGRGGLLVRIALVKALLAGGDVADALAQAREAVSLAPDVAPVLAALGEALLAAQHLPAALAELHRALRLDPDFAPARYLTGLAWLEAGEADKALEAFHALPASPARDALIARAEAMKTAPRSDPGYVRHLFDQFSADYDARMIGQLAYAAPQILSDLADLVMAGRSGLAVLDLGCGTGLAGLVFRDRAARLDGVDLSPAMVAKAMARGIYDDLAVGDIEAVLARAGAAYDLILAADTLVYLGDLETILAGARRRLAPQGYFLFTLESLLQDAPQQGDPHPDFVLGPKRRWRHSETYIRAMAARAGLEVAGLVAASPRREANQPVPGLAVALCVA